MQITPNNGERFESMEVLGLISNTVQDIIKRKENIVCNIKIAATKLEICCNIQIKKYKSIDHKEYILFDLGIDADEKYRDVYMDKKGPIILSTNSNKMDIIIKSLMETILEIQDRAIINGDVIQFTSEVEVDCIERPNIVRGPVKDIKNIAEEIYDKCEELNSEYMEIEFILEKPRNSYLLYFYCIKNANVDFPFYILNIIGQSQTCNLAGSRDQFIKIFKDLTHTIYEEIKKVSDDPAIKVNYYSMPKNPYLP